MLHSTSFTSSILVQKVEQYSDFIQVDTTLHKTLNKDTTLFTGILKARRSPLYMYGWQSRQARRSPLYMYDQVRQKVDSPVLIYVRYYWIMLGINIDQYQRNVSIIKFKINIFVLMFWSKLSYLKHLVIIYWHCYPTL